LGTKNKNVKIDVFLDGEGRIVRPPVPNRTRIPVLRYLAGKFEPGRTYREKEVNEIISRWHTFGDFFILRRLLVDYDFLARKLDGSQYWVARREENHDE